VRLLGFVLFLAGLTVASWYASKVVEPPPANGEAAEPRPDPIGAVTRWGAEAGLPFAAGLVLMIAGGVLARREQHAAARLAREAADGPTEEGGGAAAILPLLDAIAKRLDELDASELPQGAQPLADAIDELLTEQVPEVVERREALIESMGLETFAEMIGHFATMERAAARAWSALTDEAWPEVATSLERAKRGIARAREITREALAAS